MEVRRADSKGADVEGFVHIEAGWMGKKPFDSVEEKRWLDRFDSPLLLAIIGQADLTLGEDVDAVLRAHVEASPKFRGIRCTLSHHENRRVMNGCDAPLISRNKQWREGYAKLAAYDLSFDATVYHHQLDEVTDLASAFPQTPIVLCHAGTPVAYGGRFATVGQSARERERVAATWREGMIALAERPNVTVKTSGLAMPVVGWDYHHRKKKTERGGSRR